MASCRPTTCRWRWMTVQLIVGQAVTQETNDKQQLLPMIATIVQQSGETPDATARGRGLLLGREPGGHRRPADRRLHLDAEAETRRATGPVPARAAAADGDRVDRMTRKLHTKAGAAVYAARKAIVEPVFGQIKHGRGFRQFLLRGLDKVRGGMVARLHDAQHPEAVSALRLRSMRRRIDPVAPCRGSGTTRTPAHHAATELHGSTA